MTTHLLDILADISARLDELEQTWALVGGLAVSAYVEPRFTRDIDVVLAVEHDSEAEQFVHTWRAAGYEIDSVIEQDDTERLATVRSHRPGGEHGVVVDLIFASSGIEPEIVSEARLLELGPDIRVPVARPGHLVALKLLSADEQTRPQDELDLDELADVLDTEEREAARKAVELIERRGFDRGRDLTELLDNYLGTY